MLNVIVACVAGARRGKGRGFVRSTKRKGGGRVAPAASLLFSPLRPLISMGNRMGRRKIKDLYHAARLGQFLQFLKTCVILILNFTRKHAITCL